MTPSTEKQLDALFSEWNCSDSPGMAVGVFRGGNTIYAKGFGLADLESGLPITPASVFRIASVSKQFTACCIALLEARGNLSCDDEVRKHIPELPDVGATATVRHLLHHTSGIRDYLDLMDLVGQGHDAGYSEEEALAMIARQQALNFEPGAEYLYSNSGYFLLALIVKRVSGQTLRQFASENIFVPLGMARTHFHDDRTLVVEDLAVGYEPDGDTYKVSMTDMEIVGDGAVFTSVDDFARWDRNFDDNRLGKGGRGLVDRLLTSGKLNDGSQTGYAFGLQVGEYKGLSACAHGGSFVGYRTHMTHFIDERVGIVILSNLSTASPGPLTARVADILLADRFDLDPYVGNYRSEELDIVYRLEREGGDLFVRFSAAPTDPLSFGGDGKAHLGESTLAFSRKSGGPITGFTLTRNRARGVLFQRVR